MAGKEKYLKNQSLAEPAEIAEKGNGILLQLRRKRQKISPPH
jgi:hypothetical protein